MSGASARAAGLVRSARDQRPRGRIDLHCNIADDRRGISLRPRQRLAGAAWSDALEVSEGVLAVEISLQNGKRQILDFLMKGDVADATCQPALGVSLRAITPAGLAPVLRSQDPREDIETCRSLRGHLQNQLARSRLYQIMVGHLDTEARLAAFLYGLALRSSGKVGANVVLSLPMSRDDVADHLAINHDTISRVMMRFETEGFLRRKNRHTVHVTDIDKLRKRARIGDMLLSVLVRAERVATAG